MQVFKINNAKVEEVAVTKLKVWWHFLRALGSNLPSHFDQVKLIFTSFEKITLSGWLSGC